MDSQFQLETTFQNSNTFTKVFVKLWNQIAHENRTISLHILTAGCFFSSKIPFIGDTFLLFSPQQAKVLFEKQGDPQMNSDEDKNVFSS